MYKPLVMLIACNVVVATVEVEMTRYFRDTFGFDTTQIGLFFMLNAGPNIFSS